MSRFVAHTPISELRPVGSATERSYERVAKLLSQHLDEDSASLLANGVPTEGGGIDWYSPADEPVVPLSQLDAADGEAVSKSLLERLSAIRAKADELEDQADEAAQRAGRNLRNATVFPGEDCIHAVKTEDGYVPLLVGWGHESRDPAVADAFSVSTFGPPKRRIAPAAASIATAAAAAPMAANAASITDKAPNRGDLNEDPRLAASPLPPRDERPRRDMMPWLLAGLTGLATLLAFCLVVAFLIPACGLRTPFGTITFGLPSDLRCQAAIATARDETAGLQREFEVIQQDYLRRRLACLEQPVTVPPPAATPVPETPQDVDEAAVEDAERRVGQRGGAQVTLIWDTPDDLDLEVGCGPAGSGKIFYRNPSACGGVLDVDRNAGTATPSPVENVTFENGIQEGGRYPISVNLYNRRSPGNAPIPYTLVIRDGDRRVTKRGVVEQVRRPKAAGVLGQEQ